MQPQRDIAIVLRSIAYEERHRVVTALTYENGLIAAMAKNSIQSRRFGGSLELFTASDWIFTLRPGSELYSLSEAQVRQPFEKLRKDFSRLSVASVFSELMLKLAPHNEACPDLFRLHSNALSTLNEMDNAGFSAQNEILLLNAYLSKLLQWNGSQPRIHQCLECQIPLNELAPSCELSCVIPLAGWVCPSCRPKTTQHLHRLEGYGLEESFLRLSPPVIEDPQLSLGISIRQILTEAKATRQDHLRLFRFLEALFVYHVPGFDRTPLKSLRFLDLGLV